MTTTKKLKRMIERAIENGWDVFGFLNKEWDIFKASRGLILIFPKSGDWYSPSDIIFSEGFGKAVWGEDGWRCLDIGCKLTVPRGTNELVSMIHSKKCLSNPYKKGYIYHQRNLIPFKDDEDLITRAYNSIFGGER